MKDMTTNDAIEWLEWVSKASNDWLSVPVRWDVQNAVKIATNAIEKVSTTGHWEKTCFIDKYICSQCHKEYDIHYIKAMGMKYCPNCGVRMAESEE